MLRISMVLLGLGVLLASGLAQAQATGSIRVQVNGHRDVHGSDGPPGKVAVTDLKTRDDTITDLSPTGRAEIGGLPDGEYLVTVITGDRTGTTYVRISNGRPVLAELGAAGLPTSRTFTTPPSSFVGDAQAAIDDCNRVAYDRAVEELSRDEAMLEINLRDLRAMGSATQSTQRQVESRLASVKAARQQIPPFPQPCGKQVGFLGEGGRFGLSFQASYASLNLPNYKAYALEENFAVEETDLLEDDGVMAGVQLLGQGYYYIPGTDTAIRLGGSYLGVDSRSNPNLEFMPMGTQRFLFQSPGGGFSTGATVDDFRIEQQLRQYHVNLGAQKTYGFGNGGLVRPFLGVHFSYIDAYTRSEFDFGGDFAHFEDKRSLKTSGFGPTVGIEAEVPIAGGLYGFAEAGAELRWSSTKAKWRTELDVSGTITEERLTRRDKKTTWGVTGSVGIGYRWRDFDVKAGGSLGISNHYPILEIDTEVGDGDPDTGWDQTRQYTVWVRGGVRF